MGITLAPVSCVLSGPKCDWYGCACMQSEEQLTPIYKTILTESLQAF